MASTRIARTKRRPPTRPRVIPRPRLRGRVRPGLAMVRAAGHRGRDARFLNGYSPMTSDPHARLAEFLSLGDTRQNLPGVKVRDAATMLGVDRTDRTPKVLLGRRHHGHKFMPGKYVFPGGRVERADRRMSAATALDTHVEARLMKEVRYPSAEKSRGFPLAAIREVFEETG